MVKIISPYSTEGVNSLGESIGQLGKAMFGDTLTPALRREQMLSKQRENEGYNTAASAFATGDDAAATAAYIRAGANPQNLAVGRRFIAANDPNQPIYGEGITRAALGAGENMQNTPMGFQQSQAQNLQVEDMKATRAREAQVAAAERQAAASVAVGQRQVDLERWKQENTPVNAFDQANPNVVIPTTQAEALRRGLVIIQNADSVKAYQGQRNFGEMGKLPAQEQQFIGANVGADKGQNWVSPSTKAIGITFDGRTDRSGQPLPPDAALVSSGNSGGLNAFKDPFAPAAPIQRDLQSAAMNAKDAEGLITSLTTMVRNDPTIVGPLGNARRVGQEFFDAYSSVTGKHYADEVASARAQLEQSTGMRARNLLPGLFNPDLNAVDTLHALLVYKAAASLGQDGRSATDKDIERVNLALGDPRAWTQGPQTYLTKLMAFGGELSKGRADAEAKLREGNVLAQGAPTAQPNGAFANRPANGGGPAITLPDETRREGQTTFFRYGDKWFTK